MKSDAKVVEEVDESQAPKENLVTNLSHSFNDQRRHSLEDEYDVLGRKSVNARLSQRYANPNWKITYVMDDDDAAAKRARIMTQVLVGSFGEFEAVEADPKSRGRSLSLSEMYDFESFNDACANRRVTVEVLGFRQDADSSPSNKKRKSSRSLATQSDPSHDRYHTPKPPPLLPIKMRPGRCKPVIQGDLADFLGVSEVALPKLFVKPVSTSFQVAVANRRFKNCDKPRRRNLDSFPIVSFLRAK